MMARQPLNELRIRNKSMDHRVKIFIASIFFIASLLGLTSCSKSFYQYQATVINDEAVREKNDISPPAFDNNPQLDMVLTNRRPILSVGNPDGMLKPYTLTFEISSDPEFPLGRTIRYEGIKQQSRYITEKQVEPEDELKDGTYYWRARTVDAEDDFSDWIQTRFTVDVTNSRSFSGFLRAPVLRISASSGEAPENMIDWSDLGQATYWNNAPRAAGETYSWVMLDMGKPTPVTRFWMLSTRQTSRAPGWLTHFVWQSSNDARNWTDIAGTEIRNNDTYRNRLDFTPVNARYYRLVIYSQNALQAQLNAIIPYVKGEPEIPQVPDGNYVLIVGNQMNGFTYTQLARFVESHGYATVTVGHQNVSLKMLRSLRNQPIAIILSGNNADFQYLPMFEYYGEFEIIRAVHDIPMMGICAGHEFYAMAHGISFSHWMGWFADTMFRLNRGEKPAPVQILPEYISDPVYRGLPNPFRAVEIHSWAVSPLFLEDARYEEFHVTATTFYIQALKSSKRPLYSEQFHAEAVNDYNQSSPYLVNFLKFAEKYSKK